MSDDASDVGTGVPELARRVMRKQAALSLRVAAVFVVLLIFMPLFNLYRPELAAAPIFGFTLTWLILGVLFFPVTWLLSSVYVSRSNTLETEIVKSESAHKSVPLEDVSQP